MKLNFNFQGCQILAIRVAISQKGLVELFPNCCHLMLLGPKEWKHESKVLRTHFENFFNPGTLCNMLNLNKWENAIVPHLLKVVEVVVDPVLEDVEHAELDGLRVLLPEPLQVQRHPHLVTEEIIVRSL